MEEALGFSEMATESPVKMPASLANGRLEGLEADLEVLLRHNQHQRRSRAAAAAALERERELNIFRSGSAPPTVEGARNAIGSLYGDQSIAGADLVGGYGFGNALSEEEMRSHPAYLSFYYSNDNINPRLPLPAISKEDWRVAQRFQAGASAFGRIGDRRKEVARVGYGEGGSSSLFSLQPEFPLGGVEDELSELRFGSRRNVEQQSSEEWGEKGSDGLFGLPGVGLGARRKSFADALQEELACTLISGHSLSHPASHIAFDAATDPAAISGVKLAHNDDVFDTKDNLKSSLMRSTTPDSQFIRRSSSPSIPTLGGRDKTPSNSASMHAADCNDISVALSGLGISRNKLINSENDILRAAHNELAEKNDYFFKMSNDMNNYLHQNINIPEADSSNISSNIGQSKNAFADATLPTFTTNGQINLPNNIRSVSANIYPKVTAGPLLSNGYGSASQLANIRSMDVPTSYGSSLPVSQRTSSFVNAQLNAGFQAPPVDPLLGQYLQQNDSLQNSTASLNDLSFGNQLLGASQVNLSAYQKAYVEALLAQRKLQRGISLAGKSGGLSYGYRGMPGFGLGMQYPTNPLSPSLLSSLGSATPTQGDRVSRFPSVLRSSTGGSASSWNAESNVGEGFALSLLEEFKSNKTRTFELSDISEHVVEFSADQHGSRFIQQKLESASIEEKNKIFPEVLPHARALMTDVFGNYVIQKFFEHGTETQRKQLADQLTGHVLPLSLQMYGCRVIQKALEVVDVDQQTTMVLELDGSVMRCVRDQNGNHVIQKCIECVPQEKIQFIISAFYGQVVPLSTHPYGCRVIQRVLEHCADAKTQCIMMGEILQDVCTLAQDQYGNYVVQHVLQHGKPEERSAIISKLAGQIVKMSQQKFASNVVEKCLTFGTTEERQILINEMLGSTDENEPLQAMMKDQFGNYVVQKVLETCDDQNRELILSRIKAHVNSLKRYTYGKHIAARVEKVIAAGERHIGMTSHNS